jgi:Uma2 family endonuclease
MIDGVPISLKPSNGARHQLLLGHLAIKVNDSLKQNCPDFIAIHSLDWIVDEHTVIRPDISIIPHDIADFITSPPSLIVEILSPSTAHKDRIVKHDIYAEQGVKYYIIADPTTLTFQPYQLVDSKYQDYSASTFEIHPGCTIAIDVLRALEGLIA